MIRHLLKLIWNRKRSNLLITVEILFSFLVVFAVVATGRLLREQLPAAARLRHRRRVGGQRRRQAAGVDGERGRGCRRRRDQAAACTWRCGSSRRSGSVAGAFTVPYGNSSWVSSTKVDGRNVDYTMNGVTDGFAAVLGLSARRRGGGSAARTTRRAGTRW